MKPAATLLILIAVLLCFNMAFLGGPAVYNRITGRTIATVNITQALMMNCTYYVPEGWNLISFSCIGTQDSPQHVFQNFPGLRAVFYYNPLDARDPWKSYNPHLPSWVVQDLQFMSRTDGYWLRMASPQLFVFSGTIGNQTTISLRNGWNLIGYPSTSIKPVNDTFGQIFGSYSHIETYNRTLDQWLRFSPYSENNTMNYTHPFEAFWINMSSARSIVISR